MNIARIKELTKERLLQGRGGRHTLKTKYLSPLAVTEIKERTKRKLLASGLTDHSGAACAASESIKRRRCDRPRPGNWTSSVGTWTRADGYAPPPSGGGRAQDATKSAQPTKRGQQQPNELWSRYIDIRVKSPGYNIHECEFGTVVGYDAKLGWSILYDMKKGEPSLASGQHVR